MVVGRLLVGCWLVLQNLLLDQLRLRFAAVINQCARSSLVRRHKKCGVFALPFFLQFLFQVYPVWLKAVKGKNESKPENLTSKFKREIQPTNGNMRIRFKVNRKKKGNEMF